uniref:Actin-binding Rho-activating protein n=1 Tax=Geotrypetes seraphini TaxID=260995 RepID=A0A6P8Q9H8_GEOSA|nr:actin-binding Rho-activating protein-like isoform X2 [Geotrypetes seraphini]
MFHRIHKQYSLSVGEAKLKAFFVAVTRFLLQVMTSNRDRDGAWASPVGDLRKNWQSWAQGHVDYQQHNPFSNEKGTTLTVHYQRKDPEYGRPTKGSNTEQRGKEAHMHLGKEVQELCLVIKTIGEKGEDGKPRVTFGRLFEAYVTISNKVVGVLLRARKHGLVQFEGEMLWQGRDDKVVITLLE